MFVRAARSAFATCTSSWHRRSVELRTPAWVLPVGAVVLVALHVAVLRPLYHLLYVPVHAGFWMTAAGAILVVLLIQHFGLFGRHRPLRRHAGLRAEPGKESEP